VSCAAACLTPAAAFAATEPQPLVDVSPLGTTFVDHDCPVSHAALRIAGATPAVAYMTPDGLSVSVQFSRSYTPAAPIAQTYVDFLGRLPHGSELSQLKIFIAPPAEVVDDCGGEDGTLACYDPSEQTMTVPGQQTDTSDGSGVTTSYVLAHEYGHHIARHRLNPPFSALDYGPKYWSSFEQVCRGTYAGVLFPGDEGRHYLANPGEAWADTYAHITYPKTFWQFTDLLRPNTASLLAQRQRRALVLLLVASRRDGSGRAARAAQLELRPRALLAAPQRRRHARPGQQRRLRGQARLPRRRLRARVGARAAPQRLRAVHGHADLRGLSAGHGGLLVVARERREDRHDGAGEHHARQPAGGDREARAGGRGDHTRLDVTETRPARDDE
jgi:hypothetical protein